MNLASILLDLAMVAILIGYLGYGWRHGLVHSVAAIAGLLVGAVLAVLAIPLVMSWVTAPAWRTPAAIGAALLLLVAGHAVGQAIGGAMRRGLHRAALLRGLDRLLGAAFTTAAAALVLSMVAAGLGSLGAPVLTQLVASSRVITTIDSVTPAQVQAGTARLRSLVVDEGIPLIADALGGVSVVPQVPQLDTGSAELTAAARSVVRVTGTAVACGQSQVGSGFVVADDRVMTNAHVVAGVDQPMVEAPGEPARTGRVVYLDPAVDLAVIAVDGLDAAPLPLTGNLADGSPAAFQGFPFGGPFRSSAAEVITTGEREAPDVYGTTTTSRQVVVLAADVRQGNSGGPLLSLDGEVAGVIFAKSADAVDLGFAIGMDEVAPVAAQATGLDATVPSGACVGG